VAESVMLIDFGCLVGRDVSGGDNWRLAEQHFCALFMPFYG